MALCNNCSGSSPRPCPLCFNTADNSVEQLFLLLKPCLLVHSESDVTWAVNACTVDPMTFLWSAGIVAVEEWSRKDEMAIVECVKNRVPKSVRKQQKSEVAGIDLVARQLESDVRPSSHTPLGLKSRRFRICDHNCWAADRSVVSRGVKCVLN